MSQRYPLPPDGAAATEDVEAALRAWMKHADGLADVAAKRFNEALDTMRRHDHVRAQAQEMAEVLKNALRNSDVLYSEGTGSPREALRTYEMFTRDMPQEDP